MGCFLGCFGSSKDSNRRKKNSHNVSRPNPDFGNQYQPLHPNFAAKPENLKTFLPALGAKHETLEEPISVVPESRVEPEEKQFSSIKQVNTEEQLSSGSRKKVTFDSNVNTKEQLSSGSCKRVTFDSNVNTEEQLSSGSRKRVTFGSNVNTEEQLSSGSHKRVAFDTNVKEYEHISADKVPEITQEIEEEAEEGIVENCEKPSKFPTVSDDGSTLSSLSSFPPNHRYQNYRESDDECEDLDCDLSDLDNDEIELDEDEKEQEEVYDDEYYYDDSRDFKEFSAGSCSSMESGTNKSPTTSDSPDKETKTQRFHRGARVLNPVENTSQWKAMKAKANPPLKHEKENFPIDSKRSTSNLDGPNSSKHEIVVNASLSTWLVSSEKTPPKKATPIGLEPVASGASASSYGSNSVRSHEERPILGALTTEELKHFSSSSISPRRSPARSPDEKSLVGTVGVHWNDGTPIGDSSSATSFKGIPNTTSKYREDKRVKWHSTPFETRLERALNKGEAGAK